MSNTTTVTFAEVQQAILTQIKDEAPDSAAEGVAYLASALLEIGGTITPAPPGLIYDAQQALLIRIKQSAEVPGVTEEDLAQLASALAAMGVSTTLAEFRVYADARVAQINAAVTDAVEYISDVEFNYQAAQTALDALAQRAEDAAVRSENADLSQRFSGSSLIVLAGGPILARPSSGTPNGNARSATELAGFRTTGGAATGAIVFKSPNNTINVMMRLLITGHTNNGHQYTTSVNALRQAVDGPYISTTKLALGTIDVPCRMGTDAAGKTCLILGDITTQWSWPHFRLSALFSNLDPATLETFAKGWTTEFVTDLSAYTNVTAFLVNSLPASVVAALNTKADLASPALTGAPTTPTPGSASNDTSIANTSWVQTLLTDRLALKANLASPAFTGTPTVPTAAAGSNSQQAASTAFVAALGALKADLASPALTGVPTAPTPAKATNSTQISTTAHVQSVAADKLDVAATTAFTRSLLDDLTAPAVLTTLGVSSFAQTLLDDLTAPAVLTTLGVSSFAQTLLDDVNEAQVRDTLGLDAVYPRLDGANVGQLSMRNKAINGGFDYWQRSGGQTQSGCLSDDRWLNGFSGGSCTFERIGAESSALARRMTAGRFVARVVRNADASVGGLAVKQQQFENLRQYASKRVTVSLNAACLTAGRSISLELSQYFGSGGSPSATVEGIGATKIAVTTAGGRIQASFDVPSVDGKTFGTNGDDGLLLTIWFDAGSNYNTRSANLGRQSGTFLIGEVQLEFGGVATPFERRDLGLELALCQRYFSKTFDIETLPAIGVSGGRMSIAWAYSTSDAWANTPGPFQTTMRRPPNIIFYPNANSSGGAPGSVSVFSPNGWSARAVNGIALSDNALAYFTFNPGTSTANQIIWAVYHFTANAEFY